MELHVDPLTRVSITWPVLFLEVVSIDFWNRTRTEGYGYLELPRTTGEHVTVVHCWLPSGESVIEELRRFFVGGTSQLEDVTCTAIPGNLESEHLNKYGLRTKTSGNVVLRLNCAVQSWSNLHKMADKKLVHVDDAQGKYVLSKLNVSAVIKAYQKARKRLFDSRKSMESFGKLYAS
ncbi:unnamed protein product [Dicrocoelium dendriticum]|nr:unnamed protein product [Dicrocoelium dendriticum]